MTYISGTLTNSDAPATLYGTLATALTTAGFTLVDTVVISPRTHKVWKSAAASNVQNLDWYLDVAYTTLGSGAIWLTTFEFYDPTTDLGYRGPYGPGGSGSTIDAATGSRYGATGYALESTNWAPRAGTGTGISCPATAFAYWISVTPDRVIALSSNAQGQLVYAGFYEPDPLYAAKAGAKLYPLLTGDLLQGGTTNNAALTRMPPLTTVVNGNLWYYQIYWCYPDMARGGDMLPVIPTGNTEMYPLAAVKVGLGPNGAQTFPYSVRWGWPRDVVAVVLGSTVARGDTVTIDGSVYVLTQGGANILGYGFKTV